MTSRFTGSHAHPCSTTKTAIPRSFPLGSTATRRGFTEHVARPAHSILLDCGRGKLPVIRSNRCARSQGLFNYPLSSYRLVGAGLYPAWIASCSVMYLPFRVV